MTNPINTRTKERAAEVDHAKVHEAQREVGDHLTVIQAEMDDVNRVRRTTLAGALVGFQSEMPKVAKNQTATIPGRDGKQGYSYRYADLADVTDTAGPLLARWGLSFTCLPRRTEGGGYELVGTLVHQYGERLEGALPIAGRSAQEIGSSLTYLRRYLMGCLLGIVTDEDDDGTIAQAAKDRALSDRPQVAAAMWAEANETLTFANVQAVWAKAAAAGVTEERIEHGNGEFDTLREALTRLGNNLRGGVA